MTYIGRDSVMPPATKKDDDNRPEGQSKDEAMSTKLNRPDMGVDNDKKFTNKVEEPMRTELREHNVVTGDQDDKGKTPSKKSETKS